MQEYDEAVTHDFFLRQLETIRAQAGTGSEGHIALKLTGFLALDNLERISKAQDVFTDNILKVALEPGQAAETCLDKAGLTANLREHGIDLTADEVGALFESLKIDKDAEALHRTDLYANGHLFRLRQASSQGRWLGVLFQEEQHLDAALRKIAQALGVTDDDM